MFSSSGYFKGVNCPYFGNGLCERSYCHFRHVKQDEKPKQTGVAVTGPSDIASVSSKQDNQTSDPIKPNDNGQQPKGSLLSMVGNAILQVQRDIEKDKAQINNFKIHKVPKAVPLYKPTPISDRPRPLAQPKPKKPSPPKKAYIPPGIPAYNPTPIAVLNQQKKKIDYDTPVHQFTTCEPIAPQTSARITLGDAEKCTGIKRSISAVPGGYVPGKKQKVERTKSSEDEVEAKFSEEEDEPAAGEDDIMGDSEPSQGKDTEIPKHEDDDMEGEVKVGNIGDQITKCPEKYKGSEPIDPREQTDADAKSCKETEESTGSLEDSNDKGMSVSSGVSKPTSGAGIEVKDQQVETKPDIVIKNALDTGKNECRKTDNDNGSKAEDKINSAQESDKPQTENSCPVTNASGRSANGALNTDDRTKVSEKSVEDTSKHKDGKDSEKENKESSKHRSGQSHRSEKTTHSNKSSHRSRKDRSSKDSDSGHKRRDGSGSTAKKHSSSSSRHKHKHRSSSHKRDREKDSSRKRSHSSSGKHKSSHKHKSDRHHSRSASHGGSTKDSKSKRSHSSSKSHGSKHDRHSKSSQDHKKERHGHGGKSHSSRSKSSSASSKKRHRSSASSSSTSSESSHSSSSSSISSISVTPVSSRSPTPQVRNTLIKAEPMDTVVVKTEPGLNVVMKSQPLLQACHVKLERCESPYDHISRNQDSSSKHFSSHTSTSHDKAKQLAVSVANLVQVKKEPKDHSKDHKISDKHCRRGSDASAGHERRSSNTEKSDPVAGRSSTIHARSDGKNSHERKASKSPSHDRSESKRHSVDRNECKTYSRHRKDRKLSSSPKHVKTDGKSSPRSSSKSSSGKRHDHKRLSSDTKPDPLNNNHQKGYSKLRSPSGPTLFEKFQNISHTDLFGDDSDGDARRSRKAAAPEIKITKEKDCDKDIIVLSDSDRSEGGDFVSPYVDESSRSVYDLDDSDASEGRSPCADQCDARAYSRKVEGQTQEQQLSTHGLDKDEGTSSKKRVAHLANPDAIRVRGPASRGASRPSAAQAMLDRYAQIQKEQAASGSITEPSTSSLTKSSQRVAHVPKVPEVKAGHSLSKRKPNPAPSQTHTPSGTVGKDGKRVAHIPAKNILKRPVIPSQLGGKVPTNLRQRYLNQFIDECLKIYPQEQDAYDRALAEERTAYDRSTNRNIYLNVAINTIKKLRDESSKPQANGDVEPNTPTKNPKVLSHAAMLGGAKAASTNFTVNRSGGPRKLPDKFSGPDLYQLLIKYILTEAQLVENGFPRPSSSEGEAQLRIPDRYKHMSKDLNEKLCCRCGAKFVVFPEGQYARQESCSYHWGRSWKRRIAGQLECRYNCCDGDLETKGCQLSKYHVHEQNRYQNLKRYRKTTARTPSSDNYWGVYALDCEMVYTSAGSELARITVIDHDLKVVYEALVRPEHPVLDYNTRFSGLTSEDMDGVTTTIHDVQKTLLRMFSDKTILIGHSLESDCIALRLIHDTVVDTSVVFPHRMGPPLKRALRTLMAELLQKIIQNDVGGHDSKEDAVSCLELMIWKVKEDARKSRRH